MATVLLGWEIGEGLSYVKVMVQVAQALAAHGHRPVLVIQNLVEPACLIPDEIPVFQAPAWRERRWRGARPFRAAGYADILALRGYGDVADLYPMVQAWHRLLEVLQPRFLVVLSAPALCLAALGRVSAIEIAKGWFGAPPLGGDTFPLLVREQAPLVPQERLLAAIQEVQRRRQAPLPHRLPEFLTTEQRFLALFPEIDAYRPSRKDTYCSPFDPLPEIVPRSNAQSFFAYLTAEHARVEEVLTAMASRGWQGTVFLRNATAEVRARLSRAGLRVLEGPVPPAHMLAHGLLIHHGAVGTAQNALAGGRAQLLLPMHLEQEINARTLHALGVAHFFQGAFVASDTVGAMHELLNKPSIVQQVGSVSRAIQGRGRSAPLPAIVERCLGYLD